MNKSLYQSVVDFAKLEIKAVNEKLSENRNEYIEHCKPCNLGDEVKITLGSDRKVSGVVKSFGILKGDEVCITSYSFGNKMKYITTPHKSVEVLRTAE